MSTTARDASLFALVIGVAAVLLVLDPPGYFGGRWDDGRYLDAALRWVASGPVLGTEHWSLRWPVVAPAAAAIEAFGRTRTVLMLPGLATLALLLTLNFWAARRLFGSVAAAVAMLALLTTSEILFAATRLTADLPELLFLSAGAWAFVFAARTDGAARTRWLIACGVAAGLAWAVRETAASLPLVLGLVFLTGIGVPRRSYVWIAIGFLAVLLPEQIVLWLASGDPLYRLHVDLRHIEVPSTNLRGLVAGGGTAPLNASVMARWEGVGPVRFHYLVDPWLNLFLNGRYGLVFLIAGLAVLAARRRVDGRAVAILAGLAAAHIAFVVYVVATDPKPRMFMPAILCACLAVGIAAPLAWRGRARIWLGILAGLKLTLLLVTIDITAVYNSRFDILAAKAVTRVPGPVHVDRWTLNTVALVDRQTRARLVPGEPPVGGLYLTVAKRGDPHADAVPNPAHRWQAIVRVTSTVEPHVVRSFRAVIPAGSGIERLIARAPPVATLYRRLPDAPK
jgi:4-amino-4-deoxy-L-arabinose transferase-like glycosyltransferase